MRADVIPARLVSNQLCERQRLDSRREIRIEKERKRKPVASALVADAMRRRTIKPAGQAVEHVAEVADEGVGQRRRAAPMVLQLDLQTTCVVLQQNGQSSVISMFAYAPLASYVSRWVIKNAKERQRIARVTFGEVTRRQIQTQRDGRHQPMAELC